MAGWAGLGWAGLANDGGVSSVCISRNLSLSLFFSVRNFEFVGRSWSQSNPSISILHPISSHPIPFTSTLLPSICCIPLCPRITFSITVQRSQTVHSSAALTYRLTSQIQHEQSRLSQSLPPPRANQQPATSNQPFHARLTPSSTKPYPSHASPSLLDLVSL